MTAKELQAQAEREVEHLRRIGWTQKDFAKALIELLSPQFRGCEDVKDNTLTNQGNKDAP